MCVPRGNFLEQRHHKINYYKNDIHISVNTPSSVLLCRTEMFGCKSLKPVIWLLVITFGTCPDIILQYLAVG